jgi:hypothetical protein
MRQTKKNRSVLKFPGELHKVLAPLDLHMYLHLYRRLSLGREILQKIGIGESMRFDLTVPRISLKYTAKLVS